ncbi:MAG TPA: 2-oxoacid:acceptor oxidoreductase family protein [Limnochordia bacterium]|jgi:2-oxoglutarate ferredoxin oxidoreductase subunit gamma|nr:2-oxoacid:acceptor oxidoreductase family protein [Limnochordia bacterium]
MAEIICAGFGGQGVLVLGQVIAYAGMLEGKSVSWLPSYGPEQRGGTCNCSVVVTEGAVGSPLVNRPSIALIMNGPSFDRFEPTVRPGGLLLYNSSLVRRKPTRDDLKAISVPANEVADELGNVRVANMVMLGALIQATGLVQTSSIEQALKAVISERHHGLIPLNMQALERGRAYQ